MNLRPRLIATALLCVALLAGCSQAAHSPAVAEHAVVAEPALQSLAAPTPTPLPVYAPGTEVAGVAIGGLTPAAAESAIRAALAAYVRPVELVADGMTLTIAPATIDLRADVDSLLVAAAPALGSDTPIKAPLRLTFNESALRDELAAFAAATAIAPELTMMTSTDHLVPSFAYYPGRAIDLERAVAFVGGRISAGFTAAPLALTLWPTDASLRPTLAELAEQLEAVVEAWDGVIGVYLYDLATGAEIGVNAQSVFPGASTIKTAIMLYGYTKLETFTERQWEWMRQMIIESDNLAANDILSAGAGGVGTDWAFRGAVEMSDMLADLGLEHLYLYIPYESLDYIRLYNVKFRCGPKDPVGPPPYTETGCALRATPYAIAQVYRMIDECARGEGILLEKFDLLTPDRCQEMLDLLAENADDTRMVAGLPEGVRVEHKSGWIDNIQADAGIVRSPGGDYILAVYVYKPLGDRLAWPDSLLGGAIADISRLVYTAYNPIRLNRAAPEE